MYYKCHDCKEFFDEEEMETRNVCWENEYGVGGMFQDKHYSEVGCCPCCGSIEIEEQSDYDLMCEINRLNKIIRGLENGKRN